MEQRSLLKVQILLILAFSNMVAFGFITQDERKCTYSRINRMLKITCYDMNLKEVPQYLKSSVEILDLSFNRIKKLKANSFERYTDLKYLVLYDNMIISVEDGTFRNIRKLQEIDLSNNGLHTIPLEIFQLPALRNLYLDSNDLKNLGNDLMALEKPIEAPLEYLNIADCNLDDLPDLGVLPKLWQINASSNPLKDLTVSRFANMCHLSTVDLTKTSMSECSCQQVNKHLRYLGLKTKYVPVCMETLDESVCPLPYNYTVNSETFQTCETAITTAETRSTWLFFGGCAGGILIVLLIFWCCLERMRRKRAKKRAAAENRKALVIAPKNALYNQHDTALLRCAT